MRVLGLDVGDRRIGVALSDPLGFTAQRLTVLERTDTTSDLRVLCDVVEQHQVEQIVVGLPLTMAGAHGIQAQKVTTFVGALRRQVSVPIEVIDERLTTVQGERALLETGASRRTRKRMIDQVAAQLILQQFLDAHRKAE